MKRMMQHAALLLTFSLILGCISCGSGSSRQSSSASSSSSSGTYFVCYTTSSAHGVTVSSVFHVPPADQVTMLEEPWAKDFRRYIGQSGDEGGISVTCPQVDPKNPDAALKEKIDGWQKQGIQVKQIKWKYAGG
jgi:ABC-type phosphate transport system substrate-binding protein